MQTIYKYELSIDDDQVVEIPKGGVVLCVQIQNGKPCIWVRVDTKNEVEDRYFSIFGTGHAIADNITYNYVGTIQMQAGASVSHLFEVSGNFEQTPTVKS